MLDSEEPKVIPIHFHGEVEMMTVMVTCVFLIYTNLWILRCDENFGNERSTNLEIHKDMHICVLWIYKNFGSAPITLKYSGTIMLLLIWNCSHVITALL